MFLEKTMRDGDRFWTNRGPDPILFPIYRGWRAGLFALGYCLFLPALVFGQQEDQPPPRYEVLINGENFTVEENRITTLESRTKPGTRYQIAVRVAEYQPWRLNGVEFDFHRGFAIRDDRGPDIRTATLKHDLGFSMVVTDFNGVLPEERRKKAFDLLVEATEEALRDSGDVNIEVSEPSERAFQANQGLGVVISHQRNEVEYRTLAYLVTGKKLACTCVIEYPEQRQENVVPLVRPTLESFAPLQFKAQDK